MPLRQVHNMKHNSPIRLVTICVILFTMFVTSLIPSFYLQADDPAASISYELMLGEEGIQDVVLSLNIIKIADTVVDATGRTIEVIPNPAYNIDANDFDQDAHDMISYCESLVAQLRSETTWKDITFAGKSGKIELIDGNPIEPGVYLVGDLDMENGDYTSNPFIMQIPQRDGGTISYDINIKIKAFQVLIYCEVYKDTIKRTSAAYESLPGKEEINNVGDETYRVDINFRSTSSVDADEFIVDDPLECVSMGHVRIEAIWTPIVYGDDDGFCYIWYKTNLTDDSKMYSEKRASITDNAQFSHRGFKLWREDPYSTELRKQLLVSELGLQEGEYITALRFDYGAVKVGFTSMNTARTTKNDEHRDVSKGDFTLPSVNDKEIQRIDSDNITGQNTDKENVFLAIWNTFVINAQAAGNALGDGYPNSIMGNTVNWTPSTDRHDFSQEAKDAVGLQPLTYMIYATKAMSDVDIVSSAISRIAKAEMVDADQDAIVTRVIPTLQFESTPTPEPPADQQFPERAKVTTPRIRTESGRPTPGIRTRPQTGDETNIIFYILLGAGAMVLCVTVLVMKKKQEKKLQRANLIDESTDEINQNDVSQKE